MMREFWNVFCKKLQMYWLIWGQPGRVYYDLKWDQSDLDLAKNDLVGRMLKAPPVNPLTYISRASNIDPTEGRLSVRKYV